MSSSSQFEREINGAEQRPNPALIREQLNRVLAHSLFTNSKRYPVLLAYTVEQALLGNASELKERTIGVEAFGREPNYDVNLDPVVRTTAAEVRKRLIQYYYSPDHAGELIIELLVGSYVPCFRESLSRRPAEANIDKGVGAVEPSAQERSELDVPIADSQKTSARRPLYRWFSIAVALLLAVLLGVGIDRVTFSDRASGRIGLSNMVLFWDPITATSSRITYCLAAPTDAVVLQSRTVPVFPVREGGSLNVYDVITLARSIAPLVPKNGEFRVLSASDTGFAQLREGPSVMIGAFDNPWTMRITQDLPIGFEFDNHVREVVDRKSSPKGIWMLQWQVPGKTLARDYAVVARLHDRVTGQPVIILAGILGEGTEAASEVVSNPAYLDAMLERAPKNWDHLNLEAVVEADVIEGHPGPPTVVAMETW
jgi:hypothetical protein